MMLEHLGEREAADAVVAAIETALQTPQGRTRDLKGKASTREAGEAVLEAFAAA